MNKYRIVEFEGKVVHKPRNDGRYHLEDMPGVYIPRFVVQEISYTGGFGGVIWQLSTEEIKDLKEFTNIDEARAYKRSLELKEGIVRE